MLRLDLEAEPEPPRSFPGDEWKPEAWRLEP